jgi:uncharacterized protein (TIGR01244 family)
MSDLDIREITEDYAVSPQIAPEDMAAIRDRGYTTVICNRPDMETPPALHTAAMKAAADAAGLRFVENAFAAGLDLSIIDRQRDAIEAADGPVLAYCRSGTRSATVWALAEAGRRPTDGILEATARAGYPMDGMRPQIDALAQRAG